jgi:mono/diheme cytochrome c family protein
MPPHERYRKNQLQQDCRFSYCVGQSGLLGWILLTACTYLSAATPPTTSGTPTGQRSEIRALLDKYCVTCHNQKAKTAGLLLDSLDLNRIPDRAETWEKVLLKLQLGFMPPQGMPRPDDVSRKELIGFIETTLGQKAGRVNPGRPLAHRLNRAEYANAIRDLLGIDVDVSSLLPPDNAAYGFDNVADALGTSPALLQAYLTAARKISSIAIGDPGIQAGGTTYPVRQDLSQDHHIEGLPLGTIGGIAVRHTFPIDGYYDIQVRLYRTNLDTTRGLEEGHKVELALDGQRIFLASIGGDDDLVALQKNNSDTSNRIDATRLRARVFVTAGQREVTAAFADEVPAIFATRRLQSFVRDFSTYDAEGAPHIRSITIQGPFESRAPETPAGRIFFCRPSSPADEEPCARRILSTVARRAYRRPPSETEVAGLMSFYHRGRNGSSFESGIEFALRRILAAPSFIYRVEEEPANVEPGTAYRLTDFELASRLSFFLWSSIPDDELLDIAAKRELGKPEVLEREVKRMLADPRSEALVSNFAGQWLELRNLQGIVPDPELFPDFDDNLRQAFRREAELFFGSVVREDRNVLDLLTADYTFVNERLARHYGIPDVIGSNFRRVSVTENARKGLLGKGAILMVTSHANSTSPVLRGKWVMENILGAPVPPPPPDVPALKENEPGAPPRTMREQMELHRANPVCASCHKNFDPIGFALENFDVVGGWRTANEGGVPLNTSVTLADGTMVSGVNGLRNAILKNPDLFVQTLLEKLMVYGLGRGVTYEDMPVVRQVLHQAEARNYRFSALISGIVNSAPFCMRFKPASSQRASASAFVPGF